MKTFSLLFLILAIFSAPAFAASDEKLVNAQLIADTSVVAPGKPFTVAVKLNIAPTWHVYWINPGDSGIPTEVKFELPDGFTAGPLQYPAPHAFDLSGGSTVYGYSDEVLLLATISPPADLAPGKEITLSAKTGWLVCTPQNCIKGDADPSLTLKTGAKTEPANTAAFDLWRERLPRDGGKIQQQVKIDAPDGAFKSAAVTLSFDLEKGSEKPEFFPAPPDSLVVTDITSKMEANRAVVTFTVQALAGQKISDPSISAVLAYTVNGKRTALAAPIKLTASGPSHGS